MSKNKSSLVFSYTGSGSGSLKLMYLTGFKNEKVRSVYT